MAPLPTAREVNVETVRRPAVYDKFVLILGGLQLVLLVLYGVGVKYDDALFQPAASDNLPLYPNYQRHVSPQADSSLASAWPRALEYVHEAASAAEG
eukprot:jgi/Tetstr1/462843/TSEL_007793.t1